jgi:hypothetical protein
VAWEEEEEEAAAAPSLKPFELDHCPFSFLLKYTVYMKHGNVKGRENIVGGGGGSPIMKGTLHC